MLAAERGVHANPTLTAISWVAASEFGLAASLLFLVLFTTGHTLQKRLTTKPCRKCAQATAQEHTHQSNTSEWHENIERNTCTRTSFLQFGKRLLASFSWIEVYIVAEETAIPFSQKRKRGFCCGESTVISISQSFLAKTFVIRSQMLEEKICIRPLKIYSFWSHKIKSWSDLKIILRQRSENQKKSSKRLWSWMTQAEI